MITSAFGAPGPLSPLAPDTPGVGLAGDHISDAVPSAPKPQKKIIRPTAPSRLPELPAGSLSVRQFLTYLCLGTSAEDGLARSAAILGPREGAALSLGDLHH